MSAGVMPKMSVQSVKVTAISDDLNDSQLLL